MGGDEIRIAAFGGVRLRAFRDGSADGAIDDRLAGFDFRAKPLQRLQAADGDDGTVDPILLYGVVYRVINDFPSRRIRCS